MKPKCVVFALILLGLLSACGHEPSDYEHPSCVSSTKKEDCCLCGERTDNILSCYWGQDNVGLVNVNTFDVYSLDINLYDRSGQQIKEPQGYMKFGSVALDDRNISVMVDPDRGDAHIKISEGGSIDPEAIGTFLCQSCLDAFGERLCVQDTPAEIALVSFATRELRPLGSSCPWFAFGNYAVNCDFQDDEGIDLLIYYAPSRFQEAEEDPYVTR